ncbi:MAG: DEAD/DEAH box helicase [Halomonas sp.]|uniref:DEAD/DEAH box helicase n=1 Tax=Halomonas sp. TaxID=1486246 RepID=UPI002ACD8A85|nr:DEAD/DEAH box helicase [Halomonas sp.]MDZ7853494.1 DEAD/DEAH box helicase [Halomonas sp.]
MTTTVHFADALPGTGKTEALIQSLARRDAPKTLIAVPTIKLAESIERRIITAIPGFTKIRRVDGRRHHRGRGNVAQNVAKHLKAQDEKVLIIQQNTLKNLIEKPELLNGWRLVIDEVPHVMDNKRFYKGYREFAMLFDPILQGHPFDREHGQNGDYSVSVRDGSWWEARDLLSELKRDPQGNASNYALLDAAMDEKNAELYIKEGTSLDSDAPGRLDVRIAKHIDWASLFTEADEVHILGHASKKSLLSLYLVSNGFTVVDSPLCRLEDLHDSYVGICTIYVLTDLERSSKSRLLRDMEGNAMNEAVEGSVAFEIAKRASDKIRELNLSEGGILQAYQSNGWFSEEVLEALERLKLIGYAVEGLNCYRGTSASVSILHGNDSPQDAWTIERSLGLMNVDVDTGKDRIRHDRHFEAQFQHATRTAIRNFDPSTETYHFVTTMEEAESLAEKFNMGDRCTISEEIMLEVPEPEPQGVSPKRRAERMARKTANRSAKQRQQEEALELLSQGWTQKDVAEELSVSRATLNLRLLEPVVSVSKSVRLAVPYSDKK